MDMTDSSDGNHAPGDPGHPGGELSPRPQAAPVPRSRRVSLVKIPRVKIISPLQTARTAGGVAKVALTAAGEVAAWSVDTAIGVTGTVVKGSMSGMPAREVLAEAEAEVRDAVRRALRLPPSPDTDAPGLPTLREQGAALLRLSASADPDQADIHPAYAGMLAELTPDEARILRLLYRDGPQPAIDIRIGRPRGLGAERRVDGLCVIGDHAGLRFPNRVPQYLTNLRRLVLIEMAKEPVDNPNRYQLIEVQAPVRELLKRSGFGTKVHYRSIVITPFGEDFVRTCLPEIVHGGRAESS